ncbi:MAG: NUDIX hydrolase [Pseudomonadota bacterium]|nr:NUDIX hydrolase [Pseudomonadota bacterium]
MSQAPRGPAATVDAIIERDGAIVLVRRRYEPIGWALPGGFVDPGEMVGAAAVREAKEETGLDITLSALLHVYSNPLRDPRRPTLSVVFTATGSGEIVAGDDAGDAQWFPLDALPSPIVFDHAAIIADYLRFRATGVRPDPYV